jgi:5-methyltetrahydrofolate--homocysteine methyltransferase
VVLQCNSYRVTDLGVMTPTEEIVRQARELGVDVVGLSGLITPSLEYMVQVAEEMERHGMTIPLLIGGATTSALHTAVRIAPRYRGPVVHVQDASQCVQIVGQLLSGPAGAAFVADLRVRQEQLRVRHERQLARKRLVPLAQARARAFRIAWTDSPPAPAPRQPERQVLRDYPLEALVPWIDWTPFFHAWEFSGRFPAILDDPDRGEDARRLFEDARHHLDQLVRDRELRAHGVCAIWPAQRQGSDDLILFRDPSRQEVVGTVHALRQQDVADGAGSCFSLADFVAPADSGHPDHLGMFAVAVHHVHAQRDAALPDSHRDDYRDIMTKVLADRLVEAFAEHLHWRVRKEFWGYAADEALDHMAVIRERYQGIRPAPGYPACPDHAEKELLFRLLEAEEGADMRLTGSWAMDPPAAICGYYFAHPQARYFRVGPLGTDQVEDYRVRTGRDLSSELA